MASLLKMALEGSLGGIFGQMDTSGGADNQSGQPTAGVPEASEGSPTRDTSLVLRGPLGVQFSEALARLYNKHEPERIEDAQAEGAQTTSPETAATESQANDALTEQEFFDNIRIMSENETPDNSTTIYGVDAADVKPEDIVEVSQQIDQGNDLVVVMTALPGEENAQPELSPIARAMEALCEQKGVKLVYAFEDVAEVLLAKEVALEAQQDNHKFAAEGPKREARMRKILQRLAMSIGKAIEHAAAKGYDVHLKGSAKSGYRIEVVGHDPKDGKVYTAWWEY